MFSRTQLSMLDYEYSQQANEPVLNLMTGKDVVSIDNQENNIDKSLTLAYLSEILGNFLFTAVIERENFNLLQ